MARRTLRIKANRLRQWLTAVTMAVCLGACAPEQIVYSHFEAVPGQSWYSDLPLRFEPVWSDSSVVCDMLVTVRHTQFYPYGNLPLVIDIIGDSGQVTRHRVHLSVTDGHGNWQGQGFGTLYQCQALVAHGVTPRQAKRVVVWQAIDSCASLPGVSDVGISFSIEN